MLNLPTESFSRVLPLLEGVHINTLFARAVIARAVSGMILVDQTEAPQIAYIRHPYGMALLVGKETDAVFNHKLAEHLTAHERRQQAEWLQFFPFRWKETLFTLLGAEAFESPPESGTVQAAEAKISTFRRVNFRFDPVRFADSHQPRKADVSWSVLADPIRIYQEMEGAVVPRYFWDRAEDFAASGAGRSVVVEGQIAATAFAAFCLDGCLELGIETCEKWRGRGLAYHACAALIEEALKQGLEPVWSCRHDNMASRKLAHSLGFFETQCIPCFRLPAATENCH